MIERELGNWGTGELGKDFIEVMLRNKCLEGTALP
nr:protein YpfM [Salmonella enterica]